MFYKCDKCNLVYFYHYELILHMPSHIPYKSESSDTICNLCDIQCLNLDHLQNHVNQHVDISKFKCGICAKEFIHERTYKTHIQNHSREFVCIFCDKKVKCRRNLTEHLQLHTRETPFNCRICGKPFAREVKLNEHLKTHKRNQYHQNANKENHIPLPKPFKCNECDKTFTRQQHLKLHIPTHSDQSKSVCGCCGQGFLRKDHCRRHKTLHKCNYNTQECRCIVCGTFFHKDSLKTHMIEHHKGKNTFKCEECEKTFLKRGQLIFHQRTHNTKHTQ